MDGNLWLGAARRRARRSGRSWIIAAKIDSGSALVIRVGPLPATRGGALRSLVAKEYGFSATTQELGVQSV